MTRSATSRAKVAPDETEDGQLVALEMERVRHDDPVERRQLERQREVGDERRDADVRERVTERPYLHLRARPSRSTVWIEPVGPRRSARARVNAPSPDPRSAHILPPPRTPSRSSPTWSRWSMPTSLAPASRGRGRPFALRRGQADGTGAGMPVGPEVMPSSGVASGGHRDKSEYRDGVMARPPSGKA